MTATIYILTPADLLAVDGLMKRARKTLGFLPEEAIRGYLAKETVLGARNNDGELIGYLLYAAYPHQFRIVHLCVSEEHRSQGVARQLLEKLKSKVTSQRIITLTCRRDFPAHEMWPKLGFAPSGEKPGRAATGSRLTIWELALVPHDQLGLFQAKVSSDALDVVIDAQIFFDFYEQEGKETEPSRALLSDYLTDSLNLWITDELFVEIDRNRDQRQREVSHQRAQTFLKLEYDHGQFMSFQKALSEILSHKTYSQDSDIRQLAKSAASEVDFFVTRDNSLLNKSPQITPLTGLRLLSPAQLIVQLNELADPQSYLPARISGPDLEWRLLTSDDLPKLLTPSFLIRGERKGTFRQTLHSFVMKPEKHKCQLLQSKTELLAIRVLKEVSATTLVASLARVANSSRRSLFQHFLIADTVSIANEKGFQCIRFENPLPTPGFLLDLQQMGFTKINNDFVRFCFPDSLGREEVLSRISRLSPRSVGTYEKMSNVELERYCSPLNLQTSDQAYFLIPIRPTYAMSLFNRRDSAEDLFGGKLDTLCRWDNVYYRTKTHHNLLKPPARILWYVSQESRIIAVSHLDTVRVDTADRLFKAYRKFGILEWNDLYKICHRSLSTEIMALQFSHTFLFPRPVPLIELRQIFQKHQGKLFLQSPLQLSGKIFGEIFRRGYSGQP